MPVQRCTVHKLRNIARKAPKHAYDEIKADADSERAARTEYKAFVAKWRKPCPSVVESLEDGGDELLTFYRFPKAQWRTLWTTNAIERLNGEFRHRRVKTQCSLCTEDAAVVVVVVVVLFSLVATGQIKLCKLDGYQKLPNVTKVTSKQAPSSATTTKRAA